MFCTISYAAGDKDKRKKFAITQKSIGNVIFFEAVCHNQKYYKKIEKKLKNKVNLAILADDVNEAYFKKIPLYNKQNFLESAARRAFLDIVKNCGILPGQLCVCVVDRPGEQLDFVYPLAKHASEITIVTQSYERYYALSDRLYENFGMLPTISEERGEYTLCFDFDNSNPRVCFADDKTWAEVDKSCVNSSVGLAQYVPKGISACDFAGVLRHYNDFKRLSFIGAQVIRRGEVVFKITKENITALLKNAGYYS